MIDESVDAYSYWVLVGFFFWEYFWVGPVRYLVNNYFDLKIWLGLILFRIDVKLFFGACSATIFFLVQNFFVIQILRVFLIFLVGVPIFFLRSGCSWEHPGLNVASLLESISTDFRNISWKIQLTNTIVPLWNYEFNKVTQMHKFSKPNIEWFMAVTF